MTHVVVFLPGIMGSVLSLKSEVIWPGPVSSLIFEYKLMKELLSEELEPTDVIRNYLIMDQYRSIIEGLGGLNFVEDENLFLLPYDWRKDNRVSAERLARKIEELSRKFGRALRITIIAHSMGGLVSRYYLESGKFTGRDGFDKVKELFTLGTPHFGAPIALPVVLGQEKRVFLSAKQVLQASSDTRYPGAYQLLPPPGQPFAWDSSDKKGMLPLDIYESATAAKLGLVPENLAKAVEFHAEIGFARRPAHVRYFCFTGTRQTTTTHVHLSKPAGSTKLEPRKIEIDDSGDGTVPTWSANELSTQRLFVSGEHSTIYRAPAVLPMIAQCLGITMSLAGVPDKVDVALREKVVEPDMPTKLTISFPSAAQSFTGYLTIERGIRKEDGTIAGFDPVPVQTHKVQYDGVGLNVMSLEFNSPSMRGAYRVGFRDELDKPPSGFDELIVQSG